MGLSGLLAVVIIGGIAGWLAGKIVSGYGYGLIGNVVVGIVGAFVAGQIFPRIGFGLDGGVIAAIVHATLGAVILLVLIRLVKKARESGLASMRWIWVCPHQLSPRPCLPAALARLRTNGLRPRNN